MSVAPRSRKYRRVPEARRRVAPGMSGVCPVRVPSQAPRPRRSGRSGTSRTGGGAVRVEEVDVVVEMGAQAGPVPVEERPVAGEVGVEHGVEVQGPGVVVVEGAVVAVAVPAVAEVPVLDAGEGAVDRGGGAVGVDARVLEEARDGEAEEPPVVVDGDGPRAGRSQSATCSRVRSSSRSQSQGRVRRRPRATEAASTTAWRVPVVRGQLSGPSVPGSRVPAVSPSAYRSRWPSGSAPPAPATLSAARRKVRAQPSRPSDRVPDQLGRGPGRPISARSGEAKGRTARRSRSAVASQWARVQPVYGLSSRFSGGVGMMLPEGCLGDVCVARNPGQASIGRQEIQSE